MEQKLRVELESLKSSHQSQKAKLKAQAKEIKRLRAALNAFAQDSGSEEDDGDVDMADDESTLETKENESETQESDESDTNLEEEPIWDEEDGVYRCLLCNWELIGGACHACQTVHVFEDADGRDIAMEENGLRSERTDEELLPSARQIPARGSTPLLEIDPTQLFPANIAYQYTERIEEYHQLLARGATRRMCETFNLEFSSEKGIIAWADEGLFEEFVEDGMKLRDQWKIYLGREIKLAKGDIDGSVFIEELLEEAMYYPSMASNPLWETVEEKEGIWATKPKEMAFEVARRRNNRPVFSDDSDYESNETEGDEVLDQPLDEGYADVGPLRSNELFTYDSDSEIHPDDYDNDDIQDMFDMDADEVTPAYLPDTTFDSDLVSDSNDSADSDFDDEYWTDRGEHERNGIAQEPHPEGTSKSAPAANA